MPTFVRALPAPDGLPPPQVANAGTAAQEPTSPQVVFLGDSMAWGFANGAGAPVWSALNGGGALADYGVIGLTTQGLLSQLALGQLSGIAPGVVVLTIGANDLLRGQSPQSTAAGILADVGAVHLQAPQAQVLVLGVPPGHADPDDPYRQATVQADAIVAREVAGDSRAAFVDIAPALEAPDGHISFLVLPDSLHPSVLGYFEIGLALLGPIRGALLESLTLAAPPQG